MSTSKQDRITLKTYFETGDRPTEEEFIELIDAGINQNDDELCVGTNNNIGIGTDDPKEKLHVSGKVFISNVNGGVPTSGNVLEIYAPNQHGIAIRTSQNDVMNFIDDNGTVNNNPFTFSDQTGRGFRFYQHNSNGFGVSREKLGIYRNGNVGVNMIEGQMASAKLEVRGNSEDEASEGVLRIEGPHRQAKENLRFGIVEGERSWIQSHLGPLYINKLGRDTVLNADASNVGIGIEDPKEKLHVSGNTKIENSLGSLMISDEYSFGSSGLSMIQRKDKGSTTGGSIAYEQIWGSGTDQKRGGYIKTFRNLGTPINDSSSLFTGMGAIDGQLYIGSGKDEPINFNPGGLNGGDRSGWVDANKNWFLRGGLSVGRTVTNWQVPTNYALEVFEDANFKKDIKISDEFPFRLKRFMVNINTGASKDGFNTGESFLEFEGASISGFATSKTIVNTHEVDGGFENHKHKVSKQVYVCVSRDSVTKNWHIHADLKSDHDHEVWQVDVLFMRKGIVEIKTHDNLSTANWYDSLNPIS